MIITKSCPSCGESKRLEVTHEWPTVDNKLCLELLLTSQSVKVDSGKLERLFPLANDGQQLTISAKWVGDGNVLLRIERKPAAGAVNGATQRVSAYHSLSRADLFTKAAEKGVKVDKKWTDQQIAVALEEADAKE